MAMVLRVGRLADLMQYQHIKEYFENIFMSRETYERLSREQDAWVEEMNRKQLEEWRKEQALKKRDPNPKNDFDDDVPF